MDPASLSAAAIATLLLTKMVEKVGEELGKKLSDVGDKVLEQIGILKQLLWRKAPKTASAIERVTYQPELIEQQPEDYGIEVLIKKMESLAKADLEMAEVVEALAREVRPQLPPEVVHMVMASSIKVKGSMKAGNMIMKAKLAVPTNQKMLTDVDVGDHIELGDLTQEG